MINARPHRYWIKILSLSLMWIGSTSISQSSALFTFEQVGNDVVISLDGTFTVQSTPVTSQAYTDQIGTGFLQVAPTGDFGYEGVSTGYGEYSNAVTQGATGLNPLNVIVPEYTDRYVLLTSSGTAGFSNSLLAGLQNIPGQAIYEFSSSLDRYTISNTTLDAVGASGFNNTLAWTSNTGDTIHYNAIPEPSSLLIVVLSSAAFLVRRPRVT